MSANLPTTPSNARAQQEQDRIKVAVRMRPANSREVIRRGDQLVIECVDAYGEILVNDRYQSKKYSFDTVFGPGATQKTVFNTVVTPTLDEVLKGYSCTIFAYGQTGTGKTYTMEGDRSDDRALGWEDDPVAGIIPRTVAYFYDRLKNSDYSIRVSYLEIYNEVLMDLLSVRDGPAEPTLKICVNTSGSSTVQNLSEHIVRTKEEVFDLLQKGSLKRRTAETKMNERSSRSHAVFMVTLVMQQKSDIGEEVVKTGKLYLVDLAGSENISRSGAQEGRAQEAGNINKSLLTLGRVITALVERKPHIPYRDSKLTRLLQDSLGGRNKTTIIATLSPALNCLDETLSTLDYAFKAKNILNKPEINQRVSKDVHVKEVYAELERAKRDLEATWAKVGVTLSKETYQNMQDMLDARKEKIQALEVDVQQFQTMYQDSKKDCDDMKFQISNLHESFRQVSKRLEDRRRAIFEQGTKAAGFEYVTSELRSAEEVNISKLAKTASLADETISQLSTLHNRLEVRSQIESDNEKGFKEVSDRIIGVTRETRVKIEDTTSKHGGKMDELSEKVALSFENNCQQLGTLGEYFKAVLDHMDFLKKWGSSLTDKLKFGDETDQFMAGISEKFQAMLSMSREEYVGFVGKIDVLCRESREEAETKRDAANSTFANSENKTLTAVESFKTEVETNVGDSMRQMELMQQQAEQMDVAIKALTGSLVELQNVCSGLKKNQEELKSKTASFHSETVSLAQTNKEQASKVVSQLVDSFYTKLYEINSEVHDHAETRVKAIEEKGSSEIEAKMTDSRTRAKEVDACLAQEISSAKTRFEEVDQVGDRGCGTADDTRENLVALSDFIGANLKEGKQVVRESLEKIEEDVDQVSMLPTQFLTQNLRVYQPSGATPKPQTWSIDRDPVIVPPNDRLLSTFKPPSDLIATAEALENDDAEILRNAKVPDLAVPSIPSFMKSNSVENLPAEIPPPLSRVATLEVPPQKAPSHSGRRALCPKPPVQQHDD